MKADNSGMVKITIVIRSMAAVLPGGVASARRGCVEKYAAVASGWRYSPWACWLFVCDCVCGSRPATKFH